MKALEYKYNFDLLRTKVSKTLLVAVFLFLLVKNEKSTTA